MENDLKEINKLLKGKAQWRAALDVKKQKIYYFNNATKATQWDRPADIFELLKEFDAMKQPPPQQQETITQNDKEDTSALDEENDFFSKIQREEEQIKLLAALDQKDSILAKDTIPNAKKLVKEYGTHPLQVVEKLYGSYHGYPHMCKLMADWSTYADRLATGSGNTNQNTELSDSYMDNQIEKKFLEGVSVLGKRRFSKLAADEILAKYQSNPEWLPLLLQDETMSQMLLDLYKLYPDSSFLAICFHEIQSRSNEVK